MRLGALLATLGLLLAGCGKSEPPATPALWEVSGPEGHHGYLFGTIHAIDEDVEWRSPAFERAFADADTLVVEAAGIVDPQASARIWRQLATTPGLPPLTQRVPPGDAPGLKAALDRAGLKESEFAQTESWAAALTLASALREEHGDGIDLALLRDAKGKRIAEFEGVAGQLAIFDGLPQADQSALLASVFQDDAGGEARLARLWRAGNIEGIAAETHKGMLADPELREALLVTRNRAWKVRIEAILRGGRTPFVAVGAAHLAGPDGLPAMLMAKGYAVKRIQ
ncbi:MAG TPA: TraB/GumN family protein [Croceibacterium sp.]|nr:TraB/GumN family protein [Croceibacterium sp.]